MSKTGVYIYDEVTHQVVKVSDEIPRIPKGIWYPKGGYRYFDKALQREFSSKTEKRDFLKANKLIEAPQMESDKHRQERCAEIVNVDRKKQGLKPRTVKQLKGDWSPK